MKYFSQIASAVIFLFFSSTAFTQSELSDSQRESLNEMGPELIQVLIGESTLEMPTKDQYSSMISAFDHRVDEKHLLLAQLDANYSKRTSELPSMINAARTTTGSRNIQLSTLTFKEVQMKVKNNSDSFTGGNAVFTYIDSDDNLHHLVARALYNVDENWYLLNDLTWN